MANVLGTLEGQESEPFGTNDLATKITKILAKDIIAVEKRIEVYYELGNPGGADFYKLYKDAGNNSWIYFHTMLLQHFSSCTDIIKAKNQIITCLKSLDLKLCANQIEMLDLTTGLVRPDKEIFWHNVDDLCPNFVGREKEFAMIEKNIQKQNSVTEYTVLTGVSGIGGIGKTTLARKFAHYFCKVYNGSVVWIPAENASLVANEFTQIAEKLNLRNSSTTRNFTKSIYKALLSKNDNLLFIFDNLNDPITGWIHDFLPKGLVQKRPFILITSRRRDFTDPSNLVDLDVLSPEDALLLQMIKNVLRNLSSEVGEKLAQTLQFYPLALQIAVSEIGCVKSSRQDEATQQFIQEFDRNRALLLDDNDNTLFENEVLRLAKLTKLEKNLKNQNEYWLTNFTETLLIVLVALLSIYSLATLRADEMLLQLFMKSFYCDSNVLKEIEHFVRLKDEFQQCFNILEIDTGDFESDFEYFVDNVQLKSTSVMTLKTMKKTGGVPLIIKDHTILGNIMSKFKYGWDWK